MDFMIKLYQMMFKDNSLLRLNNKGFYDQIISNDV